MATGRRVLAGALAFTLSLSACAPALGQDPAAGPPAPAGSTAPAADLGWPRQLEVGGNVILVYQPQPDTWEGNRLEARAAFSVRSAGRAEPAFGVIGLTARTEVDKVSGLVRLENLNIAKASFPAAPEKAADLLKVLRQHIPTGVKTVPLVQLEASLAAQQVAAKAAVVPVQNDPPRIIFSERPALLVRVDGAPVLRQVPNAALMRAINTRALILLDTASGRYYLSASDRWLEAPAVEGPWAPATRPPAALDAVKQAAAAVGQVDLLDGAASSAAMPAVFVSTVPAELIETQGPPDWSPIAGTDLLYVRNTPASVFLELGAQSVFVLISGRWFRARSTSGPWEYVPPAQLPPGFARIPEQHPRGAVLASVPGTPQAQEALIANTIPQTATINRSEAKMTAVYDGAPRFAPIPATPLQYAVNSPVPLIRVDAKAYYALYNGVWFVAPAATGPWTVAVAVPAVIYTIPLASPLHYVTYVHVYGYTPTTVYVGYTPGYLGTVTTPDGVVVYGTGVVYTPWIGTAWYPPPATYGAGAGSSGTAAAGFMMGAMTGMAIGAATWGACCASTATVNVNRTVNSYSTTVNGSNVYSTWGSKTVVSSGDQSATVYRSPSSAVVTNNQNNNVYAAHDGNVYRKEDGTYQKWDGSSQSWQTVQNPRTSSSTTSAAAPTSSPSSTPPASSTPSASSPASRAESRSQGTAPSESTPAPHARTPGAATSAPMASDSGAGRFGSESPAGRSGSEGWLDRESAGRERGFQRFEGARAGGFFRHR
jgi:hypothetical protein